METAELEILERLRKFLQGQKNDSGTFLVSGIQEMSEYYRQCGIYYANRLALLELERILQQRTLDFEPVKEQENGNKGS